MRISFKVHQSTSPSSVKHGAIEYSPEDNTLTFRSLTGVATVVSLEGIDFTIHADDKFAHPSFGAPQAVDPPTQELRADPAISIEAVALLMANFAKELQA